jgi:hypothetical protein
MSYFLFAVFDSSIHFFRLENPDDHTKQKLNSKLDELKVWSFMFIDFILVSHVIHRSSSMGMCLSSYFFYQLEREIVRLSHQEALRKLHQKVETCTLLL